MVFLQTGRSQAEIIDTLNCSKNTISREFRCNSFEGQYDSYAAQGTAMARCEFAVKAQNTTPKYCRLYENGSNLDDHLNIQAIDFLLNYLYKGTFAIQRFMIELIKTGKGEGNSTRTCHDMVNIARKANEPGGSIIPNCVDIAEHLPTANERTWIENGEGNTVYGQNTSLVTLVERTSRFTLCGQTQTKCKDETASVINILFDTITNRKKTLI